jgi:glycosyltransferase involved in cell wall biosynthesis
VKEADTLADAGYAVEVLGVSLETQYQQRDMQLQRGKRWSYTPLFDASSTRSTDRLRLLVARARVRFWSEAYARIGVSNPRQFGLAVPELLAYSLANPADLYVLHNPDSLPVGVELLRRGLRIAVDLEDWYSEDFLPNESPSYPVDVLRRWEKIVLTSATFATTTSQCLSDALVAAYGCRPPAVVHNSFSMKERNNLDGSTRDRTDQTMPSMCWFSQVMGPERGLETLMDALADVRVPFHIHLRGHSRPEYRSALLARAPAAWRGRIHFHPQVSHSELIARVAEHDVGFAAEIPYCRNKALTISNKLPFYLLAGVGVVASDTEGQREVAALAEGAVALFRSGDPRDLAAVLNRVLSDDRQIQQARRDALIAAQRFFCWERSAPVLLKQVGQAFSRRAAVAKPAHADA